jgi:hypothetical protein
MNRQEFDQYLEMQSNNLSEEEFFALIIKLLEDASSKEAQEILESYLMAFSFVDEDRATCYWEKFLSNPDPFEREDAALKISMLAGGPGSHAYKVLREFLGEEPKQENLRMIFKERYLRIKSSPK